MRSRRCTPAAKPASFSAVGGKRDVVRLALRELHAAAPAPVDIVPLPQGAPFGTVDVNVEGCTLCLSCVSACPTGALSDDPERPLLRFAEDACVQCGLCQATCPEKVISLEPRLDFRAAVAPTRIIKQEEPALCIRCGKPFGVKSSVDRVTAKLEGQHWMYKGLQEAARRHQDVRRLPRRSRWPRRISIRSARRSGRAPHHRRLSARTRAEGRELGHSRRARQAAAIGVHAPAHRSIGAPGGGHRGPRRRTGPAGSRLPHRQARRAFPRSSAALLSAACGPPSASRASRMEMTPCTSQANRTDSNQESNNSSMIASTRCARRESHVGDRRREYRARFTKIVCVID